MHVSCEDAFAAVSLGGKKNNWWSIPCDVRDILKKIFLPFIFFYFLISLILFINLITSDDFVNVNVLVFYSPLHRQSQSQQTLQLHPWQANPEPYAKHPLHLGGVKQWLKKYLLNSSLLWWRLECGTSVPAVHLATTPITWSISLHWLLNLIEHRSFWCIWLNMAWRK